MSWGQAVPQAWGQHGLRLGLQDAGNYDGLTDVVVACKGGVRVRSHRLVLASLSPMVRAALDGDGMREEDSLLVAPAVDAYELTNFLCGALRGGVEEAPLPESLDALCVSYQPASRLNRVKQEAIPSWADYHVDEEQDFMAYEPNVDETAEWLGGEDPLEMEYRAMGARKKKRKKGSEVWKFFRKQGNGETVECLHCKKVFKNNGGGTSTMFRHLKKVHDYRSESQNTIELDGDGTLSAETPTKPSILISTVKPEPLEITSEDVASLPAELIGPATAALSAANPRKVARSNIWKFFEKIDDIATCMDCGKEFKADSGTSTLGRHLKKKHEDLFEKFEEMNEQDKQERLKAREERERTRQEEEEEDEEEEEEGEEGQEGSNEVGEDGEGKENRPAMKKKKKKVKKIRSSVWKYFQRIKDDSACCNQCGKVFSISCGTTTGLIRHLGRAHTESYDEIVQEIQVRRKEGVAKLTFDWTTGTFVPKKKIDKTERKVRKDKLDQSDPAVRTCPHPECGKVYAHRRGMLVHYESAHSEHEPWVCNTCGKTFTRKESWQRHNHDTARPFLCPTCGKTFKNRRVRDVHERSHRDDRRYPCSFCEKRFFTSAQKKVHERIHQGIKPYVCGVCGKSFVAKHQLTTHSHIHTGARPHKCLYCDRAFRHLSTKAKHNCPNKPPPTLPLPGVIIAQTEAAGEQEVGDEDDGQQQQQQQVQVHHQTQWSTLAHEEIIYQQQVAQAVHSIQTIQEIKPQPAIKASKKKRRRF